MLSHKTYNKQHYYLVQESCLQTFTFLLCSKLAYSSVLKCNPCSWNPVIWYYNGNRTVVQDPNLWPETSFHLMSCPDETICLTHSMFMPQSQYFVCIRPTGSFCNRFLIMCHIYQTIYSTNMHLTNSHKRTFCPHHRF